MLTLTPTANIESKTYYSTLWMVGGSRSNLRAHTVTRRTYRLNKETPQMVSRFLPGALLPWSKSINHFIIPWPAYWLLQLIQMLNQVWTLKAWRRRKEKKKKSIDWTFSPPTPSTSKNYFFTADFLIPLCLESLKLPAFYSLWLAFWLSTAYMNDNFYTG